MFLGEKGARCAVMETIKKTWQLNQLEFNGTVIIAGYVTAAILFLLTYIRFA
jgi:hypothetical protein